MHSVLEGIRTFRAPVIGVAKGAVSGFGVDLLLSCDIVYVAESFQILPALSPSVFLARLSLYIGPAVNSNTALDLGLVTRVHSSYFTSLQEALSCAAKIAEKSPVAITGIKAAFQFSKVPEGLKHSAL